MNEAGKWYYPVKVEFLAVKEEIDDLIKKGYCLKSIFNRLKESGKITMSYTSFCDYARNNGQRIHGKKKPKLNLKTWKERLAQKAENSKESKPAFVYNPRVNLSELV